MWNLIPLTCGILRNDDTNELIYKTGSQTLKTNSRLSECKGEVV